MDQREAGPRLHKSSLRDSVHVQCRGTTMRLGPQRVTVCNSPLIGAVLRCCVPARCAAEPGGA
eukprot:1091572-Pleurochrysis_carterae.AAC.4